MIPFLFLNLGLFAQAEPEHDAGCSGIDMTDAFRELLNLDSELQRATILDLGEYEHNDFRITSKYYRMKWNDKKTTDGIDRIAFPYAFHESVPVENRELFKRWLGWMQDDLSCIDLIYVDNAMANSWDYGVLFIWGIDKSNLIGCSSCIGRCPEKSDVTVIHKGEEYKLKKNKELKPLWQTMNFHPDCFRPSTVQHEVMHALGFMHEQTHPDRDQYLYVDEDELEKHEDTTNRKVHNFHKVSEKVIAQGDYKFELGSVMMYQPYLFGDNKDIPGMVFKDWKPGQDLWVKNMRRLTTVDALAIDWFYCKSPTTERDNRDVIVDGLNPEFIPKSTVECTNGDLNGIKQPVFKDRICDGYVDCFVGLSDEDGTLGECVESSPRHPEDERCPAVIHATHKNLLVCQPEPLHNGKPAWFCPGDGDNPDYHIFWVENISPKAWPKLSGSNRSGWIFSRQGYNPSEDHKSRIMAYHQTPNEVSCPPEGQWQHVHKDRYGQIYTYSKKDGIKMPDLPASVSICGDPTHEFNGEYDLVDPKATTYKRRNSDKSEQIYFDQTNRFWVVKRPGRYPNLGHFHTTDDHFELFGATWVTAGTDGYGGNLPGHTLSHDSSWTAAPQTFTVVPGNTCPPDNNTLPQELFVCGTAHKYEVDGKYEKQSGLIDSVPYYRYVGDQGDPNLISSLVIYWNQKSGSWMINSSLGADFAKYHKKGSSIEGGTWMVSPGAMSYLSETNWIPSDLVVERNARCPKGHELPEDLFVCGSVHWAIDGQFEKTWAGGMPHYESDSGVVIYWEPVTGVWIINRNLNGRVAYYYLSGYKLESSNNRWMVSPIGASDVPKKEFPDAFDPSDLVVSSVRCDSAEVLYVCSADEDDYPHLNGQFIKQSTLQNGVPFYRSQKDGPVVLFWEPTSQGWLINSHLGNTFGWYHLQSKDLLNQNVAWQVSKPSTHVGSPLWKNAKMFLSESSCGRPVTGYCAVLYKTDAPSTEEGTFVKVEDGKEVNRMKKEYKKEKMNNAVSYVMVEDGCTLEGFRRNKFKSPLDTWTSDTQMVKKFNNKMSSFKCNCAANSPATTPGPHDPALSTTGPWIAPCSGPRCVIHPDFCPEYRSGGDDSSCPRSLCQKATLEVIDSWKTHDNTHGMVMKIWINKEEYDSNGWSVLLRFGGLQGNFQLWNANIFNTYRKSSSIELLLHQKWDTGNDKTDEYSFTIVAERLRSPDAPELYFWNRREKTHSCFSSGGSRSTAFDRAVMMSEKVQTYEDVTRFRVSQKGTIRIA